MADDTFNKGKMKHFKERQTILKVDIIKSIKMIYSFIRSKSVDG